MPIGLLPNGSYLRREVNMEDKKLKKLIEEMRRMGIRSGKEIAELAKELHPNAIAVVPLYRSCMVILQTEEDKRAGMAKVIFYCDPAWLGHERTKENLRKKDFHEEFVIVGQRSGPNMLVAKGDRCLNLPTIGIFEMLDKIVKDKYKYFVFEKVRKEVNKKLSNLVPKITQLAGMLSEVLSICHDIEDYILENFDRDVDEEVYDEILSPILNIVEPNAAEMSDIVNHILQKHLKREKE